VIVDLAIPLKAPKKAAAAVGLPATTLTLAFIASRVDFKASTEGAVVYIIA